MFVLRGESYQPTRRKREQSLFGRVFFWLGNDSRCLWDCLCQSPVVENVAVNLDSWRVCESRYEDSRRVQDGTTARAGQPWGGWMVVKCELGVVWVWVEGVMTSWKGSTDPERFSACTCRVPPMELVPTKVEWPIPQGMEAATMVGDTYWSLCL